MKTLLALVLALSLVGCATEHRLPYSEVSRMYPDCSNKDTQINYLERQLALPARNVEEDRHYRARVKTIIWTLRSSCPPARY
jgi:hypothetical protein